MAIIEEQTPPIGAIGICANCTRTIRITGTEEYKLTRVQEQGNNGRYVTAYSVSCPGCGRQIFIKSDEPVINRQLERLAMAPRVIHLEDSEERFGEVRELTSREFGTDRVSIAEITLYGPDVLHYHKFGEETYICLKNNGIVFDGNQCVSFRTGDRIIIPCGALHAVAPSDYYDKIVYLCISSPAYDSDDVFEHPLSRSWNK